MALSGVALLNVVCCWLLEFMLDFASLVATICRLWLLLYLSAGVGLPYYSSTVVC